MVIILIIMFPLFFFPGNSLQEAQKRMKIKKAPYILVIHLKRFKYIEQLGRYKKLSYRVVFPLELKLNNTMDNSDSEYSLFAVVVHVGSGPNHGHYISLVKSHNHWLFFDDENVEMIDESTVQTFFGSSQEYSSNTDHGYILFYESIGGKNWKCDLPSLHSCETSVVMDRAIFSLIRLHCTEDGDKICIPFSSRDERINHKECIWMLKIWTLVFFTCHILL